MWIYPTKSFFIIFMLLSNKKIKYIDLNNKITQIAVYIGEYTMNLK